MEDIGFYAGFLGMNLPKDDTSSNLNINRNNFFMHRYTKYHCRILSHVGASLMLGRALTSTTWGTVADRIGRKPVIGLGIFSVLVFVCVYIYLFALS